MALSDNALTNLAQVKVDLVISGSGEDTYLERLIETASDLIKRYCNRTFYWEEDIVEYVAGFGTTNLVVSRRPVTDITYVKYNGSAVSADDYKSDTVAKFAEAGIIYNASGWYWSTAEVANIARDPLIGDENPLYEVKYDGGWVTRNQVDGDGSLTRTLPFDLEQACIDLVVLRYRSMGRDPSIKSEKLLSWAASYDFGDGIPDSIKAVLDKYVTAVIG